MGLGQRPENVVLLLLFLKKDCEGRYGVPRGDSQSPAGPGWTHQWPFQTSHPPPRCPSSEVQPALRYPQRLLCADPRYYFMWVTCFVLSQPWEGSSSPDFKREAETWQCPAPLLPHWVSKAAYAVVRGSEKGRVTILWSPAGSITPFSSWQPGGQKRQG